MRSYPNLLLITLLLVGCVETPEAIANGDDPLRALEAPVPSDRYGTGFWSRQMRSDAHLWGRATAFCNANNDGEHPNCDAVRYVEMMDRMSTLPEDRPNDFQLTLPQGAEPNEPPRQP